MQMLEEIYYDPAHPAGYVGARNLERAARGEKTRTMIKKWLAAQDTYTLHKSVRRNFERARYEVFNIDEVWEADLADLSSIRRKNNGHRYLLVFIDVLSKYAWVVPLKCRTANFVAGRLQHVLTTTPRRLVLLQTDKGEEFVGQTLRKLLSDNGIRYRTTFNPEIKAVIVERFNWTLKKRLWRYFTHKNSQRYVDVSPLIFQAYNETRHSSIGMSPAEVTLENAAEARAYMQKRYPARRIGRPQFRENDIVRISKTEGTFQKGYEAN
ncbi:uncharacterized protein LOC125500732 [Athalia rosae]|uniref:uncharacterized protein LOC125500732 n=1 Tax=Athalia rosae TaxID=37344 RepID=UPI002033A843|nr:uncharacterized protein LOC125500732 [Athalia rosae]